MTVKGKMQKLVRNLSTFVTPSSSSKDLASAKDKGFQKAPTTTALFPTVPEDCQHDCTTCTISYPRKFQIDEEDELYGFVKGWSTHIVVGTGKTDWVRDVADEKDSVMEAVGKFGTGLKNGRCMLSASNMPTGDPQAEEHGGKDGGEGTTRVLLLPAWKIVDGLRPADVPALMTEVVEKASTNINPLQVGPVSGEGLARPDDGTAGKEAHVEEDTPDLSGLEITKSQSPTNGMPKPLAPKFSMHACPHRAIILMCSQKTRDARCGQSAPLLRKEFERHLRPLGLYRDIHDERPGGVGIYFISHVDGHKYSANVMIYRRQGRKADGTDEEIDGALLNSEAVQGIWLARVRPEDCEGIVKYTVMEGKVVKPDKQLRGGFDREKGLVSW